MWWYKVGGFELLQLREEASKSVALRVRSNQSKRKINVGLLNNCCSKRVRECLLWSWRWTLGRFVHSRRTWAVVAGRSGHLPLTLVVSAIASSAPRKPWVVTWTSTDANEPLLTDQMLLISCGIPASSPARPWLLVSIRLSLQYLSSEKARTCSSSSSSSIVQQLQAPIRRFFSTTSLMDHRLLLRMICITMRICSTWSKAGISSTHQLPHWDVCKTQILLRWTTTAASSSSRTATAAAQAALYRSSLDQLQLDSSCMQIQLMRQKLPLQAADQLWHNLSIIIKIIRSAAWTWSFA